MEGAGVTKRSRQRTAILETLRRTKLHPTADWIYAKVRQELPNISLGTVYRNLSKLASAGMIQKMDVGDGAEHFDAAIHPHYHLYCEACGRLLDLDLPYDKGLNHRAEALLPVLVNRHSLIFHGLCGACCEQQSAQQKKKTI